MRLNKYILGLDLGQQNDYTVLSCLIPSQQDKSIVYSLPYLKRLPLKTPYPTIVELINNFISSPRGIYKDYVLIVDYTGVGRPVVDLFKEHGLQIISINITGGNKANWVSRVEANVPKRDIVSAIQVVMQNKRLKIAHDLPLLSSLSREFLGFKAKISSAGRDSYEAISGLHDDIVLSIGVALWYGEDKTRRGSKIRIIGGS